MEDFNRALRWSNVEVKGHDRGMLLRSSMFGISRTIAPSKEQTMEFITFKLYSTGCLARQIYIFASGNRWHWSVFVMYGHSIICRVCLTTRPSVATARRTSCPSVQLRKGSCSS